MQSFFEARAGRQDSHPALFRHRTTLGTLTLDAVDGRVAVTAKDDAAGFDTDVSRPGHQGLAGMQLRADSVAGVTHTRSARGGETTVRIRFPQMAPVPPAQKGLAACLLESPSGNKITAAIFVINRATAF